MWRINFHKHLIEIYKEKNKRPVRDRVLIEAYYVEYSFIFLGTRPSQHFHEFRIMLRKILTIFAAEYLRNTSSEIQVLVCLVIAIVGLMVSIKFSPYDDPALINGNF